MIFAKYTIIIIISLLFYSCVPGSMTYQPLEWEQSLLKQSIKTITPLDIVKNSEFVNDKLIHWVGIVDTFEVFEKDGKVIVDLKLDQRFYDYIEDYSIQQETMFISPFGEGKFYMRKIFNSKSDSLLVGVQKVIKDKLLAFCYGNFIELKNTCPVLDTKGLRFIPKKYYATNIFSYKVARDSSGKVISTKEGYPLLTDFKMLKVPKSGKNE